jgi:hypothetical protein
VDCGFISIFCRGFLTKPTREGVFSDSGRPISYRPLGLDVSQTETVHNHNRPIDDRRRGFKIPQLAPDSLDRDQTAQVNPANRYAHHLIMVAHSESNDARTLPSSLLPRPAARTPASQPRRSHSRSHPRAATRARNPTRNSAKREGRQHELHGWGFTFDYAAWSLAREFLRTGRWRHILHTAKEFSLSLMMARGTGRVRGYGANESNSHFGFIVRRDGQPSWRIPCGHGGNCGLQFSSRVGYGRPVLSWRLGGDFVGEVDLESGCRTTRYLRGLLRRSDSSARTLRRGRRSWRAGPTSRRGGATSCSKWAGARLRVNGPNSEDSPSAGIFLSFFLISFPLYF